MARASLLLTGLVIAGLTSVTPAAAASFGIEAFGSYNTHLMSLWNGDLEVANAGGSQFNRIDHTLTGGVGLQSKLSPIWLLQIQWEPLFLESRDSATGRALVFDTQTMRLDVTWLAPSSSHARFGLGAGLGYYWLDGRRESGGVPNAELSGNTLGLQVHGLMERVMTRGFLLHATAGYRLANITDTRVNGISPARKLETDYSGWMLRLGLAYEVIR
jgi:hypothetical protein